jgi:hypothetical protein
MSSPSRTRPRRSGAPVTMRFIEERTETPKAHLFVMEGGEEVWLPKSQILSINWDTGELELPRWLAEAKQLLPADGPAEPAVPRIH